MSVILIRTLSKATNKSGWEMNEDKAKALLL